MELIEGQKAGKREREKKSDKNNEEFDTAKIVRRKSLIYGASHNVNIIISETRPDTRPIRSRCWWAGAVMRVGRGSIDARQEL